MADRPSNVEDVPETDGDPARRLRLGTRTSALARWQADWVASALTALGIGVEIVPITTRGDARSGPLIDFGGVGAFTKELQFALLDHSIDLAVHSLKDLPTDGPPELAIAAVPPRAAIHDVLVSNSVCRLAELPAGSRVGTGSIRRRAQLLHAFPRLAIEGIRGNVDTRLCRLDEGRFDAIVLAEAGLARLGLASRIAERLAPPLMFPAVGQGALAIETRADDARTRRWVERLDDRAAHAEVVAERALLRHLRAGCLAPVGAVGRSDGDRLTLDAVVLSDDGLGRVGAGAEGRAANARGLGIEVAERLLEQGADVWLAASRRRGR